MNVEVSYANGCLDEFLLRELASYDIQCPELIPFIKTTSKNFIIDAEFSCFHWSRQYEYTWCLRKSDIKKDDFILDAGGGYSILKYALAKRCKKVIAIDTNEEHLSKTNISAKRLGFHNIECKVCPIQDYKSEEKFDKIFCISVLEHIKEKNTRIECIKNMLDLLKPNGQLFLSFDFIVCNGKDTYDFYIDKKYASELLHWFGVDEFESNDIILGTFASGCSLATVCIKATK